MSRKFTAYTTFEIGRKEVLVKFAFDYYSGANEYKTWNGWQPAEPENIDITNAYFVWKDKDGKVDLEPLPDSLLRLLDDDAHEGGSVWDDALEVVYDKEY